MPAEPRPAGGEAALQVLAHPDPHRLEAELIRRVADLHAGEPAAPALVIVPTRVLADHVRRRLAQRLGVCLGVEIVTPRSLARLIREDAGLLPARALSPALAAALLDAALDRLPAGNRWRAFLRRRPTARRALLGTLREMREAGLSPDLVSRVLAAGEPGDDPDLAALFEAHVKSLASARRHGVADDADLAREATDHARAWAGRFRLVLLHGVYELTGCNLALVQALSRSVPTAALIPLEPGAPAFAYAETFATGFLVGSGRSPERLPDDPAEGGSGLLGRRLGHLHDDAARPEPLPEQAAVSALHVQGEAAEISTAAHVALQRVRDGVAPSEIALISRTLHPYAAAVDEALGGDGLPFATTALMPLRRQPRVHDLLRLLRLAADDFPRAATAHWLASPRIDWSKLGAITPPAADRADEWSRAAGILGGLEAWSHDLPAWALPPEDVGAAGSGQPDADAIVELPLPLERACEILQPDFERTWADHAAAIGRLEQAILVPAGPEEEPAMRAWRLLLADLALLDRLRPDPGIVPYRRMLNWLEEAVAGVGLPLGDPESGGIRVLDAMQSRGLTFDTVIFVGLNAGLVPRPVREDPILPDEARGRLRQAAGMPLPAKADGDLEERLILAQVLGAAGRSMTLTWQRAGGDGRTRMPSLALREMARIITGSPDPESLVEDRSRLPAALDRLAPALEARFGLASPREVLLHTALQAAEGDTARQELAGRHPDLAPGLEMLARLESFAPAAGPFDARIGDAAPLPAHLGVSSVERLGRCPARYFFQRILRLPEEEAEARLSDLEARDMGRAVHAILESCWQAVLDGPAGLEDRKATAERLQAELEARWPGTIARLLGPRQERLPVLWRRESERWRAAVAAFLERDPVEHLPEEFRGMEMEGDLEGPWPGGGEGAPLLHGRFDRRVHGTDREVHLDDYKTGGKLPDMASETEMLKLRRLQVPLYHLLSGGAGVRLLGVGPDFLPGGRRESDAEAVFAGFSSEEVAAAFRASLASALDLLRNGVYPMNPGAECGFCSYTRACRRLHPPSRERDEAAADAAGYRLAGTRSRTRPGGRR